MGGAAEQLGLSPICPARPDCDNPRRDPHDDFAKQNAAAGACHRWIINGVAYTMSGETLQASFHLKPGSRYRIRMRNAASDDIHPIQSPPA